MSNFNKRVLSFTAHEAQSKTMLLQTTGIIFDPPKTLFGFYLATSYFVLGLDSEPR